MKESVRVCNKCGKDFIVPPDNSDIILSTNGDQASKYGKRNAMNGSSGLPPRVKANAV